MADQFPLVADGTAIKELPSGDNLDLTGSNIVGAGTVALTNLTVSGSQGTAAQVLQSTGSGIQWGTLSAGGITDVVNDTSPQLGGTLDANSNNIDMGTNVLTDTNLGNFITAYGWGNHASAGYLTSTLADTTPQLGGALDVNGQDIVSTSNGDIDLAPNGSGVVVFKGNATKGAGQFKLNCENNSHGIIIKGPPHSASANYTLTLPTTDGNADQQLKTDGSGNLSWVDAAGGGGAWNVISSTTVSSAVASVVFTGVTGYKTYKIIWSNVVHSSHPTNMDFQFSADNGSNYNTTDGSSVIIYGDGSTTSLTVTNHSSWSGGNGRYSIIRNIHQFNTDQKHAGELTLHSMNDSEYTYFSGLDLHDYFSNRVAFTQVFGSTRQTTAFNALRFQAGNNFTGGTFTLYGLANS